MLCPFCLSDVTFQRAIENGPPRRSKLFCPVCKQEIPLSYAEGYKKFPSVIISAVGFRGHGKSVYFASLFHVLNNLSRYWDTFHFLALNDNSLQIVYDNLKMLDEGFLPQSTPKNFPVPTIIRINNMPVYKNSTWLLYDTAGESFENSESIGQYAYFVKNSNTVLFLISINDLENISADMDKLLNTYIIGINSLRGDTRKQHLVVVYTKGDTIDFGSRWNMLRDYLIKGDISDLADVDKSYLRKMRKISGILRNFTTSELNAHKFLAAAESQFKSTVFSIVSALGAAPEDGRISTGVQPRRVFDPLLWLMEKSKKTIWKLF